MINNKRVILSVMALILLVSSSYAAKNTKDLSLKQTVPIVINALLEKDVPLLERHVDFDNIVSGKVKKYANIAKGKESFLVKSAGKLTEMSEPVITKAIRKLTLSEYSKAKRSYVKWYVDRIDVKKVQSREQIGFVSGVFMGKPFFASVVNVSGYWVVKGLESPLIDEELKLTLRNMHVIK